MPVARHVVGEPETRRKVELGGKLQFPSYTQAIHLRIIRGQNETPGAGIEIRLAIVHFDIWHEQIVAKARVQRQPRADTEIVLNVGAILGPPLADGAQQVWAGFTARITQ